jgi:hypothetical protein
MLACEIGDAQAFDEELAAFAMEMGLAGQHGHGRGAGLAVPVPVSVGADAAGTGFKLCGKVARTAADSPVGKYNGPFCPHAARKIASPRIDASLNICKL